MTKYAKIRLFVSGLRFFKKETKKVLTLLDFSVIIVQCDYV